MPATLRNSVRFSSVPPLSLDLPRASRRMARDLALLNFVQKHRASISFQDYNQQPWVCWVRMSPTHSTAGVGATVRQAIERRIKRVNTP